jgi:hypothetical protein
MFDLPAATRVAQVIPKKELEKFANPRQKRLLIQVVKSVVWKYKLAPDTVQLFGVEVTEIQVFEITLKVQKDIKDLLVMLERAIPYALIIVVRFEQAYYLSASIKHPHPLHGDTAVIDHTFCTGWQEAQVPPFRFTLKNNLDFVFQRFLEALQPGLISSDSDLRTLAQTQKERDALKRQVAQLKKAIAGCRQFNQKVALNLELSNLELQLREQ